MSSVSKTSHIECFRISNSYSLEWFCLSGDLVYMRHEMRMVMQNRHDDYVIYDFVCLFQIRFRKI